MKNASLKKKIAASVIAASISATAMAPIATAQEGVVAASTAEEGVSYLAASPNSDKANLKAASLSSLSSSGGFFDGIIQKIRDFWNMITQMFGSSKGNNDLAPRIENPAPPAPNNGGNSPAPNNPSPNNPAPSNQAESIRTGVVNGTNNFRRQNDQSAKVLKVFPDSTIQAGAQAWADHMARTGTMGHDPNIHNVDASLLENVYIASNSNMTAQQVIDGWARSSGHRKNMLSGTNKIGVGAAQDARGTWYVVARYKYDYSWKNEFLR